MKTITIIAEEREWTVLLTSTSGRGFVVTFPEITGLITDGRTLTEARAKAVDFLLGYLASLAGDLAALAALEAVRQQSRFERELREARDGEPSMSHAVAEQWVNLWDTDRELYQPECQ